MNSRRSRGRLQRISLPFVRVGPGTFGPDGLNVHMLCEDVGLYLLPISRRRDGGITIRLEPNNDVVERLVVSAFSDRNYRDELTEVVSDWMGGAARDLIRYGVAPYELARVVEDDSGEEEVVGVRVMGLEPSEVSQDGTRLIQRTLRRDDAGRPLAGQIEERVIPAEFIVLCRLPAELERARARSIAALQTLDSMRTSELMLEGLKGGGPPIDFGEIRRAETEAVAAATRPIGWNARDPRPYNGFHLTYRQLQFERFLCELRDVLVGFAQEVITKAGRMLNFEASLVVEGLPTVEDIERAESELAEGKRPFVDIMSSVRGD